MAGEWTKTTLGELIDIKHGFAFGGEFFCDAPPGDVLLTPGNFAIGGGFKSDKFKYYDGPVPEEFVLCAGDLLITMTDLSKQTDTLGYPAFVPPRSKGYRYLHNQRLGKVVVKDSKIVDLRYLHYLMCGQEYRNEVIASATGTTVKHTSPERIKRFRFWLPPPDEQRSIAHILGALDDKIELNRRMNEILEAIARAFFKSWFVDFDPIRAKISGRWKRGQSLRGLPAHFYDLFPDRLVDSELGEIPDGWRLARLGEIADIIDCLHSKKPERRDNGQPLLQLWNIRDDGLLDMSDTYFINEVDYRNWISRMEASHGDCVVTNVGRVGAVSQIPEGTKAALGRNMTGVRCKSTFPSPTFLIQCLLSEAMRDEIAKKKDTGTILDALNVRNIPSLRMAAPPVNLLTKFEEAVRPMRARMENNLAHSRVLAALRNALLPKLISGKIEIKNPERFAEIGL